MLKDGTLLGKGHQTWQMNEINRLIWPAPLRGIGVMNPIAFARTAAIAKQFKVITKLPSGAYRTDLAKAANATLRKAGRQHDRPHVEGHRDRGDARRKVGSTEPTAPGPTGPGVRTRREEP